MHVVGADEAGATLAAVVRGATEGTTWNRARELCSSGRVWVDGRNATDPAVRLQAGAEVAVHSRLARARSGLLPESALVHVDRDFVIVDKPSGLLSIPYAGRERDTLVDITRARLRRIDARGNAELGVVQRLDKETSGLLVFTRTLFAKRALQRLWRAHDIDRRYVALVHGHPTPGTIESLLVRDRGDGLRGSFGHFRRATGAPPREAQRAVTHVRVLRRFEQASLVECRLHTGRQHQIRIHLSEAGNPLLGERVYVREHGGARLDAPRVMLHARVLGFAHPRSGEPLRFSQEPPEDFAACLAGLQG